ncbi:MAG TPA: hypothetical protein DD417_14510 [Elusimicrobia bacterium]|nr:hypothetical protein [Elusimicrobiota bacterium]
MGEVPTVAEHGPVAFRAGGESPEMGRVPDEGEVAVVDQGGEVVGDQGLRRKQSVRRTEAMGSDPRDLRVRDAGEDGLAQAGGAQMLFAADEDEAPVAREHVQRARDHGAARDVDQGFGLGEAGLAEAFAGAGHGHHDLHAGRHREGPWAEDGAPRRAA